MSDPNAAKSIFLNAVEKESAAERSAYLDDVCGGDAPLRQRVEALLRAHDDPESAFEKPAAGVAPNLFAGTLPMQPAAEAAGAVIGRFKLLQQIGEGGFGVVYLAEQQEPVRRRVALKIIKPGMDSRQVIARFEAERQALAMMEHPNIATRAGCGGHRRGPALLRDGTGQGRADHRVLRPEQAHAARTPGVVHSRLPGHPACASEGSDSSRHQAVECPGMSVRRQAGRPR